MTVQLAMRKNDRRLTSRFVGWWTGSKYSHCELLIDGLCYSTSMMDKGVRRKLIDLNPRKWDVVDLHWASKEQALIYFEQTKHHSYGWAGLVINQLLNMGRSTEGAQFCSQWCANALTLPNPATLAPQPLLNLGLYLSKKLHTKKRDNNA